MKKKLGSLLIILIAFMNGLNSHAQKLDAGPEQLQEFKDLTKRRVEDFQNYLQQIADKSLPERLRRKSLQLAKDLFDTTAIDKNGKRYLKMPIVQISRRDGSIVGVPINTYLDRLYDLKQFPKVEITAYDVSHCSDYQKGKDGNYHATAFYYQDFKGYDASGTAIYTSRDRKAIQTMAEPNARGEFTLYFGNITIVETLPNLGK